MANHCWETTAPSMGSFLCCLMHWFGLLGFFFFLIFCRRELSLLLTLHLHKNPLYFPQLPITWRAVVRGFVFCVFVLLYNIFQKSTLPPKPAKQIHIYSIVSIFSLGRGIKCHILVYLHVTCKTLITFASTEKEDFSSVSEVPPVTGNMD